MLREKQRILVGLLFLPFVASAHGEKVFLTILSQIIVCVFIIIAISITKWKPIGKAILLLSYVLSIYAIELIVNRFPYRGNELVITFSLIVFPLICLAICYFLCRRKFEQKMHDNSR
jgi:predicted neutral ceramidase superfamily lipid hydrolase